MRTGNYFFIFIFASFTLYCTDGLSKPLGKLQSIAQQQSKLEFITQDGESAQVEFLSHSLFRIWIAPDNKLIEEGSKAASIVIQTEFERPELRLIQKKDYHLAQTDKLALRIYPDPLRFELYKSDNSTLIWQELKPIELSEKNSVQTLENNEELRFFGGGQQNGSFEFHNKELLISYSGGWEEGDRPNPAPFYMTNTGYGVLRNTWSNGSYDFRSAGYLTASHEENRFDAYYFNGNNLKDVLAQYTQLTGRAKLLPRWAFEYGDADCYNDEDNINKPGTVPVGWSDGDSGTTPDVVTTIAKKYREHDMPGGWILPNDGYGCKYKDLPKVVRELAEYGFNTGLWTEDGVDKIAWEVGTAGSRAQKLDVAWTGKGYQFSLDANKAAAEGIINNSDSRPFIWTVMGWAGTQRYSVTWTGDQSGSWDYIRWHVPTLIGSGLSGQVYATGDVDGIFGGSAETFTRDLQWKSLTPVYMGMSGWSKSSRKHPWWFEEPYRSINRKYMKLKMRLIPYIYSYAWQAEQTGAPVVRGLMWDHQDDLHAFDETASNQYFLGENLLVAPVFKSQASSGGWRENVYLPEGQWIDYWDGRVVNVNKYGKKIDVEVDLEKLPIFVKGGAIIPMYPEALYDGQVAKDRVTFDLYPYDKSSFELYEDDGNTRQYQQGKFSLQQLKLIGPKTSKKSGAIRFEIGEVKGEYEGQLQQRFYDLNIHSRSKPKAVKLNGDKIRHFSSRNEFAQAEQGWLFDSKDKYGNVLVKLGEHSIRQKLQVSLDFTQGTKQANTKGFPTMPKRDNRLSGDLIKIVSRPTEEPGYPLENAFDGKSESWFRSVRDYSQQTGPHEFVLAFGERLSVNGIEIAPRNDEHWKYGQVRDYEIYMGDINGEWGEPIAKGKIEAKESIQKITFKDTAGRLLRIRVLSTQDQGSDPMILNPDKQDNPGTAYNAFIPIKVSPLTISEMNILLSALPNKSKLNLSLATMPRFKNYSNKKVNKNQMFSRQSMTMNGLIFSNGLHSLGDTESEFRLKGNWQTLKADLGIDDSCIDDTAGHFQIYGDARLLFDSGEIQSPAVVKPELDMRGLTRLRLATRSTKGNACFNWANIKLIGFEGDIVE